MPSNLEQLSDEIWSRVCTVIEGILKECQLYGLAGILTIPNPSVEARLVALRELDDVFDRIIESLPSVEYTSKRHMFNAKQQVLNLERLLNAAKSNDQECFDEMKKNLNGQSKH